MALKIPLRKRGKLMSALEDAVVPVLSPWYLSLGTGFWGWGGTGNVPPLTLCPSTAKEGLESPNPALLRYGDNKSKQSTYSPPANSALEETVSLLKEVGEPLLWSIMHLHFNGNKEKWQKKKMNKTCLLLVIFWDNIFSTSNLYPEKRRSFLYMSPSSFWLWNSFQ